MRMWVYACLCARKCEYTRVSVKTMWDTHRHTSARARAHTHTPRTNSSDDAKLSDIEMGRISESSPADHKAPEPSPAAGKKTVKGWACSSCTYINPKKTAPVQPSP